MAEIPRPGATEKDIKNQDNFRWGFFSGLTLLKPGSIPPTDITESRRIALEKLVDMSRNLPQIGVHDPAGIIESLMASAEARAAARREVSTETPEAIQSETVQPKRGIIRKILGR